MKFQFKIQQYQTEAVEDTVNVFRGQPSHDATKYRRDIGRKMQGSIFSDDEEAGYRNADVELTKSRLLNNIRDIQIQTQITPSTSLAPGLGAVNLDIEMETGTGKTYVYIKTMFELNKRYGWSKFIVVVPSIAIREGVAKSFSMLEDHFMEHYGKKARWFVYNSSNLNQLDQFSQDSGISVMIINTQAFAASLKEGGRSKESRIIYSKRDEFGSRRPIDVIAANRPIIIMDEPQKMEGAATQTALAKFKPLFVLNYSATHKTKHDTIYALDAYDAYRERLVKRIAVHGFEIKNLKGTSGYMYLDGMVLSPKHAPEVRLEIEVKRKDGTIRREVKRFSVGDSLANESGLAQYDGYTITEINPRGRGYVTFLNGKTLYSGEVVGDTNEEAMQRVQIRQTIIAHLDKEKELFNRGIKCLSLFFIDEVSHYRSYDEEGNEIKGKFQKIFEEEYARIVNDYITVFDTPYDMYLRRFYPYQTHCGYFSIDKKGRSVNSETKRGSDISDDISAYDLILKNKERLLSFDEPTRFIFSHSALREGWDNPNVFQICTLRHSSSTTAKRQEVGRGLRICVDKNGIRQDKELLGEDVHLVNQLTVIANESYTDFTSALQRETREALRDRITAASQDYFLGKIVTDTNGEKHTIDLMDATLILGYLYQSGYVTRDGNLTPKYHADAAAKELLVLPDDSPIKIIEEGMQTLIAGIFNPKALEEMVEEATASTEANELNENFSDERFQKLWNEINHKYVYTVHYDSDELIEKSIAALRKNLTVTKLQYVMVSGEQDREKVTEFGNTHSTTRELTDVCTSSVPYDLVGDIAKGARLTRRSVVKILQGIGLKALLFKNNPEEFIRNVIKEIREQKATMIVEHITYNPTAAEPYDSTIFVPERRLNINKAIELPKHITPYVACDSDVERAFAKGLQEKTEVAIFAKLPRKLKIPTPVGNYAPDWAIVFEEGCGIRHIFFIAETKGTLEDIEFRGVEKAKIECAKRLFNSISTGTVRYNVVDKIEHLGDIVNEID
ncbi:MAG: DEAD/DEAH box helicase family protein [Candidatus Amulumruptor caecigallinarius]|nr:DEAD/DEAH box helicase family protein [Candidatus Amulumruptor caecigallinarius]